MTLEEAIKHARSVEKDSSECKECNLEHKQLADWLEELLALREQHALQKQIAKCPVDKTKPDNGYSNYYKNGRIIVCPNCNGRLKLKSKGQYCDKCGQKLKWGE